MTRALQSELNIWYLDDGSLGGNPDTVLEDLKTVIQMAAAIGLRLNFSKCEIMVLGDDYDNEIYNKFNNIAPGHNLEG